MSLRVINCVHRWPSQAAPPRRRGSRRLRTGCRDPLPAAGRRVRQSGSAVDPPVRRHARGSFQVSVVWVDSGRPPPEDYFPRRVRYAVNCDEGTLTLAAVGLLDRSGQLQKSSSCRRVRRIRSSLRRAASRPSGCSGYACFDRIRPLPRRAAPAANTGRDLASGNVNSPCSRPLSAAVMARFDPAAPRLAGLLALVLVLVLAACAGTQARDPHAYEVLAEASLPRDGLTREMLRVMGEVAREGAVALVLEEVGRDHGYDDTWRPGNRYYDRAAELVERSMEPMLSRMDPTPLLERNLTRSLQRNLTQSEAQQLIAKLATPEGRRFTEIPRCQHGRRHARRAWRQHAGALPGLHGGAAGAPAPAAGGGARSGYAQRG